MAMRNVKFLLLSAVCTLLISTSLFAQSELSNTKTCPPLAETFKMFQKGNGSFNLELGFSRFKLNDGNNYKPSLGFDLNYYPVNNLGLGFTSINNYGFGSAIIYPFTRNMIAYGAYHFLQHTCTKVSLSFQAGYIFNQEKLKVDGKIEQATSNSPMLGLGLYRPLGKLFYLQANGRWLLNGGNDYSFASNIVIGFRFLQIKKH
jgi:hypothetical protein